MRWRLPLPALATVIALIAPDALAQDGASRVYLMAKALRPVGAGQPGRLIVHLPPRSLQPDSVAIRAAAIRTIHPIAGAGPFLLVQDSASGVAETKALARELGGAVRYVTSAPALRDGEMAIRAQIVRANATEALVRVHFWGPMPGAHPPGHYWSEYLVTLRRQDTAWTVVKHVQRWAT